jgi:hypothetical protein
MASSRTVALVAAIVASLLLEARAVKIFAVNPSRGSIAGGTRMHIQVRAPRGG